MIMELSDTQARCLPSVPTTVVRILNLAQQNSCRATDIWDVVHRDPASVLALLLAAQRQHPQAASKGLLAAIESLGVNRALSVSLSFRLPDPPILPMLDYIRYWRRAMLTAAYARVIARRIRSPFVEQIHATAILHNVGEVCGSEGVEWLAGQGLAEPMCQWLRRSHAKRAAVASSEDAVACLALAAGMAEVWLCTDWKSGLAHIQALAQSLFGAVPDLCSWAFGVLGPQADDLESLARIHLPGRRECAQLYGRAELLRLRLGARRIKQNACELSGR